MEENSNEPKYRVRDFLKPTVGELEFFALESFFVSAPLLLAVAGEAIHRKYDSAIYLGLTSMVPPLAFYFLARGLEAFAYLNRKNSRWNYINKAIRNGKSFKEA